MGWLVGARWWTGARERVLVLVVGFVVVLLRPADGAQRFTLGSEDANVFVPQPRQVGLWRSLTTSYNGYQHLLPRLVGGIASLLPLRLTPTITYIGAAAVVAGAATVAYACVRGAGCSRPAAALIGATVLILPAGGYEVAGNLPNLEWYCLAASVVFVTTYLMGHRPSLRVTIPLLLLAGLTTPLLAVSLPFLAFAARRRGRHELAVLATAIGCVIVQLAEKVRTSGASQALVVDSHQIVRLGTVRVGAGAVLGDRLLPPFVDTFGLRSAEVVGALVLVIVAALVVVPRRARLASASAAVAAAAILLASLVLRAEWFAFPDIGLTDGVLANGRYMSVPALCLVLVVVLRVDRRAASTSSRPVRVAALAASAVIAAMLAVNVPVELHRPSRASFDEDLSRWQAVCAAHGNDGLMGVRTGPWPTAPGGFELLLGCHDAFD